MTPLRRSATPLLVVSLLMVFVLLNGCESVKQRDVTVQSVPLIQQIDSETKSTQSRATSQTLYTYDVDRHLTRKAYSAHTIYTSGTLETWVSIITNYMYNPEGFLVVKTETSADRATGSDPRLLSSSERTTTTTYAYTAGRVTSYTVVDKRADGTQATRTGTYAYDATSDQVRQTETVNPAFSRTYTYSGGVLTDYVERNGAAEMRPWQLKDGLITKMTIEGGYVGTYAYDAQQRPTRLDVFINGKRTEYTVWTNDALRPATDAQPVQKGFPVLRSPFGREGVMLTEKQYFINPVSGQTQFFSEQQARNQSNVDGFVTGRTISWQAQNPQTLPQSTTTTETYTYLNQ